MASVRRDLRRMRENRRLHAQRQQTPILEPLEPRVLLSADGSSSGATSGEGPSGQSEPPAGEIIVFVDPVLESATDQARASDLVGVQNLLPAGYLDLAFGNWGVVTTPIGSSEDYAESLAIQSDGKIVVAGHSYNYDTSGPEFALARYNLDGSLDTSFGVDGKVVTPVGSGGSEAHCLAIQSDGKIVIAGYNYTEDDSDFALARYNPDGSLDASFGDGGRVITPVGPARDEAYSLAVQSDDKIVVAGWSSNGSDYDFALVRYNSNGSLDTSFGAGGKVMTPIGSGENGAY